MTQPTHITLPNVHTLQSTHETNLELLHAPTITTNAHIFPELWSYSLISLGQL